MKSSFDKKSLRTQTQMESRRGLENVIISNGKVVNVVSDSYGHIPNQLFFKKAEEMLSDAQLNYHKRTINRNDRSFITDFIIEDKSQCFGSKIPMMVVKKLLVILSFIEKYIQLTYMFNKLKMSFLSSTVRTMPTL